MRLLAAQGATRGGCLWARPGTAVSNGSPVGDRTSNREMSVSRMELAVVTVDAEPLTDIHQPSCCGLPAASKATSW
jgi:hypothetical protein